VSALDIQSTAWAERQRLHWLDDETLVAAVDASRGFLRCEAEFIGYVEVIVASMGTNPFAESPEAIARALLFLARHGTPHGLPSTD
jgi:hypothetical protein